MGSGEGAPVFVHLSFYGCCDGGCRPLYMRVDVCVCTLYMHLLTLRNEDGHTIRRLASSYIQAHW